MCDSQFICAAREFPEGGVQVGVDGVGLGVRIDHGDVIAQLLPGENRENCPNQSERNGDKQQAHSTD